MAAGSPVMSNALCSSSTCLGSFVLLCLYGSPAMGWKNPCRQHGGEGLEHIARRMTS